MCFFLVDCGMLMVPIGNLVRCSISAGDFLECCEQAALLDIQALYNLGHVRLQIVSKTPVDCRVCQTIDISSQ
jgi:hypothetical protein